MDRDTELTAYLLRYLYDNHYFDTMEEMAVALDISKRQIQRLINNVDSLKGGKHCTEQDTAILWSTSYSI